MNSSCLGWNGGIAEYHCFRELFFLSNAPTANQAEVIHAGWAHRDTMGVSLLDSVYLDVRDSLLMESKLSGIECGTYKGGTEPNSKTIKKRNLEKDTNRGVRLGQDVIKYGISMDNKRGKNAGN